MAQPLCPYFGNCGSCTMQDVDYSDQLESKRKVLADAVGFDDIKVFGGNDYYYRNRMDMPFHEGGLGFRRRGKWWEIVDIEQCAISNRKLNLLIKEVRDFFVNLDYFDVEKKTGTFRYAVIRTPTGDSSISIVLNKDSERIPEAVNRIKMFASETSANNVVVAYVPKITDVSISEDYEVIKGSSFLKARCFNREFYFHVQGFFQNNNEMADKVNEYCHELLQSYDTEGTYLVDMYGGVGVFGINNADKYEKVIIIENSEVSIEAAKKNMDLNNIINAETIAFNAKRLREVEIPGKFFLIADPSRQGIHPKAIKHLNIRKAEAIIYVSCNAKQLKLDLEKLEGYRIKSAALFDLFPQTPHLESVVELIPT